MKKLIASLCIAALCIGLHATAFAAEPYSAIINFHLGDNRKDCSAIEDEIRAARPADYKPIEQRLLATLAAPGATDDCKFFICRQLMIVGSDDSIAPLAALLTNDKLSFGARFALERNTSPKAAAALRDALSTTSGQLQIGVISSLGARKDVAAVPQLAKLAAGDDATALAAIRALGDIPDAAGALQNVKPNDKTARAIADAELDCARALAARGDKAQAIAVFQSIKGTDLQSAAALGGILANESLDNFMKMVPEAAGSNDRYTVDAAANAVRNAPLNVRNAVAATLPGMKPEAQAPLLAAIMDQQDVTLRPALLALIGQNHADIQSMAIETLANHGTAQDVPMLVKIAAGDSPVAAVARRTLERMGKDGVDDSLGNLAATASPTERQVAIRALTTRRVVSALPALSKLAGNADQTTAVAALKGLGDIGTEKQLPAIVNVLGDTADAQVRRTAEDAAKSICTRSSDKKACSQVVASAVKQATAAPVRAALLRVLNRIGDDSSLAIVREMANSNDQQVKDSAIRALVEWPTAAVAPDLLNLMQNSPNTTYQVLALRGYVHLAASGDISIEKRVEMYRQAIATAKRDDAKKTIIAGLADLPAPEAYQMLADYLKEDALANEVTAAAVKLSRNLGALAGPKAKATLQSMKASVTSDQLKKQLDTAIAEISRGAQRDGYIVGWLIAGPYEQGGKSSTDLFNIAFAPEKDGSGNWRPAAAGQNNLVGLDRLIGGQNRVAYLKTILNSDTDQDVRLEFGSDDGIKVWVNGKQIIANNVTRPCTPGSDKATAHLNKGANTLLAKVTQGGGEWSAVCRIRSTGGGAAQGVSVGGE